MIALAITIFAPMLTAAEDGLSKKMLPIYVKEAEAYSLAVASNPKKRLELKKEPIFEWANPTRNDQQGVVFLWLRDGRPAGLACIFSGPHDRLPGRILVHELHALDPEKLVVTARRLQSVEAGGGPGPDGVDQCTRSRGDRTGPAGPTPQSGQGFRGPRD